MEPWVPVAGITVIGALVGAVWLLFRARVERVEKQVDDHVKEDAKAHQTVVVNSHRLDRIDVEIGDRKSGIRGELHAQTGVLTSHELRIEMLEKDRDRK